MMVFYGKVDSKSPDDNRLMGMQRVVQKTSLHPVVGKVSGDLQFWLSQPPTGTRAESGFLSPRLPMPLQCPA
jgi:hypothetical protein